MTASTGRENRSAPEHPPTFATGTGVDGDVAGPAASRTRPAWHRKSGRLLVVAGLVVAGSGLWMTLFYPDAPGGTLLWVVRLLVGSGVAVSIALAFTAIRRRDIPSHRAWMIRAYALAAGAGAQVFTQAIANRSSGPVTFPRRRR